MRRRKTSMVLIIILYVVAAVAGYYLAAGVEPSGTVFTWYDRMKIVLESPLNWYFNNYTVYGIGISFLFATFVFMYYWAGRKNFRNGEEQGSAQFGNVKEICKKLEDPNNDTDDEKNIVIMQKKKKLVVNTRNRIVSQNLRVSIDTKHTDLNNNEFVIGGSGSGKTFRYVKPNIMQMFGSYIITDPKGEIQRSSARFLKNHGYKIKVLNLLNPKQMAMSSRYNPFKYVTNDDDIVKLVTIYMDATKKENSQENDQFWSDNAGILLQAYFYYVHYKGVEIDGKVHHDFRAVMHIANKMQVIETQMGRKKCEIDTMFDEYEKECPGNLASLNFKKATVGAADTVRSIVSTLNSRLGRLQTDSILDLLSDDEIEIPKIGVRKTAIFCVIPDVDKTYNFVVSMLYAQMFQQLYYQADFVYDGSLPVHVTFMLDEFANVALPDNYLSLLSTMRSRNISSIIIIQNLAQIKKLYKEEQWESIPGNCDVITYLGGNEASTHKWLSEMLGKETINKHSDSESKGKNGSVSKSTDVMQRELMYQDEIRKMPRKKCLILINGENPIYDLKIKTLKLPFWKEYVALSKDYLFDGRLERIDTGIITISSDETEKNMSIRFVEQDEVSMLKEEDAKNQKDYEYECEVARRTGSTFPEKKEDNVTDFEVGELMWIIENLKGNIQKDKIDITSDDFIKACADVTRSEPEGADEIEGEDIDEDKNTEDIEDDNIDGSENDNAEEKKKDSKYKETEDEFLIALLHAKFTSNQIEMLLPLRMAGYTSEKVLKMVSFEQTEEEIFLIVDTLKKYS